MHRGRFRAVLRTIPAQGFLDHRVLYVLLVLLSAGLIVFDRLYPEATERGRTAAIDSIAPLIDGLSRPVATVSNIIDDIRNYVGVYQENDRLRRENDRLASWQQIARGYEVENVQLRRLLNVPVRPGVSYISARVIAQSGGSFVRVLVANVGSRDGVRKGQAAVVAQGLVGRVGDVGARSSRILLLTDLNSRVPVLTVDSQARAILAGDNTSWPQLIHLPAEHRVKPGEEIITSGHGGMFPPGLTVGRVAKVDGNSVHVETSVEMNGIEFVRLADHGFTDIIADGS